VNPQACSLNPIADVSQSALEPPPCSDRQSCRRKRLGTTQVECEVAEQRQVTDQARIYSYRKPQRATRRVIAKDLRRTGDDLGTWTQGECGKRRIGASNP
jgi:hypothetical protein